MSLQELHNTHDLVEWVLVHQPETRNSDNKLYISILKILGNRKGIDIENMSITRFLLHMKDYGIPSIESVGRARRKIVEMHPQLAGTKEVQDQRRLNEQEYKAYSRMGG